MNIGGPYRITSGYPCPSPLGPLRITATFKIEQIIAPALSALPTSMLVVLAILSNQPIARTYIVAKLYNNKATGSHPIPYRKGMNLN